MNKVKKSNIVFQIAIGSVLMTMFSCQSSPTEKIQGVFKADKSLLKNMMEEKIASDNGFASTLLENAIKNALIEFKISGDSINGLMFLVGQTTVLSSKIQVRNDSMIVQSENSDFYLIPNDKGILFKSKNSDQGIQLIKSNQIDISAESKGAIKKIAQNEKELKEFNDNLGKWQKGNFVDEFGDNTGKVYPYLLVRGDHENASIIKSDVFIKTTIDGGSLYFQIFNSSMSFKENFPDNKFGTIKIKFPNGDVKNETIFFYKNMISESPDDNNELIYKHLMNDNGELKILIDLSTASEYYSDKYQFTISKNNLDEILTEVKK
ncbi:MAG: hypothetical protein IPN97_09695 [Saprospiraceae bacterium]|nr:hypothetical protein [Saprospiraceae bacterium]